MHRVCIESQRISSRFATWLVNARVAGYATVAKAVRPIGVCGVLLLTVVTLVACGGDGGGGSGGQPPAVSLSSAPSTVAMGGSALLSWSSTDATSCTASGGWTGNVGTSGSQSTGPLTASTTYTLTCTGAGGSSAPQSATVTVTTSPAPTVSLSASPTTVAFGGSSTLSWSSTNATSCTASGGWTGALGTSGSQSTGALASSTTYILTCTGTGGSSTPQSATVTVTPTVSLSASPTTIASGGSSTLSWTSTNATSCTASGGWTGTLGTSGSQSTGALASSTTYTLTCTGAGGISTPQTASVTVTAAAPTVMISASPTTIGAGGTTTLTWSSTNATSCAASNGWSGTQATSGAFATPSLSASTTTFTIACSGPGGTSTPQSVTVAVMTASGLFPLQVVPGSRQLFDAQGNQFLMVGDSPWDLIATLSDSDIDTYLNDRQSRGINTILVELMEHLYSPNAPNDFYGNAPFTTPGDFSTPNPVYFNRAVGVIQKALNHGMLVVLTPSYMGYQGGNQGWYQEMVANGPTKLRAYGQYLAHLFAGSPNILWLNGADFAPPEHQLIDAVANGIRDVNTAWLHTMEGGRYTTAYDFTNGTSSAAWLGVNTIYADQSTMAANAAHAYGQSTMPFFLVEGRYELDSGGVTEAQVRLQAYQSMLGGATGQLLGNQVLWQFSTGWQAQLSSPGAVAETELRALFSAFSWWLLQPNGASGNAGLASDHSFEFVYVPSGSVTVNLGDLAGPHITARWYDPTNGTYTSVNGSPFGSSGSQTFTTSGNNSTGDADWVLVLTSTP